MRNGAAVSRCSSNPESHAARVRTMSQKSKKSPDDPTDEDELLFESAREAAYVRTDAVSAG